MPPFTCLRIFRLVERSGMLKATATRLNKPDDIRLFRHENINTPINYYCFLTMNLLRLDIMSYSVFNMK